MNREQFRIDRVARMDQVSNDLLPEAQAAIESGDYDPLLAAVADEFIAVFTSQPGFAIADTPSEAWSWFRERIMPGIEKITPDSIASTVAGWLGTAVVNGARVAAAEGANKTWISRKDGKVRPFHVEADGQTVLWSDPFTVCDGVEVMFPGEPVGDPSCWINCRCVAGPASMVASPREVPEMPDVVAPEDELDDIEDEFPDDEPDFEDDQEELSAEVQWHGVLAPEGVQSGDGRTFALGALTWRDLPLPLRWQKADTGGHDGAVTVATIDNIERKDNMILGSGRFLDTPESDEAVGMIAEKALKGVSIDADQAELAEEPTEGNVTFGKGRISAATLVAIPAFAEAYIALGPWPEQMVTSDTTVYAGEEEISAEFAISEQPWDGSASRFTNDEWRRSCVLHKCDGDEKSCHGLPIKEPGGSLSRAGVHAAAARFNQVDAPPEAKASAASQLRGAYKQLGEDVPDALAASADEDFARGPGWVTNPVETRRLHAYWTKPGHKGYAKVRWGTPGDFTRLRRFLAKYISPTFLNRVAAQWHFDALGYWPGELGKPGNPPNTPENRRRAARHASSVAEPINLVAASIVPVDSSFFDDPQLDGPTGLIVDGQHVYGHIALWETCHVGIKNVCTTPPRSEHDYAYFRTGAILTDQGRVSVGHITLGTGHAGLSSSARSAASHYDNTGAVVADVAAGEDEHGIWISGLVRSNVTDEQIYALQAGAISGDWRAIGGSLELIAALVVNVPGFPVQRPSLAADAGEQISLVAAGVLEAPVEVPDVKSIASLVIDEIARRERVSYKLKSSRAVINEERIAALKASMLDPYLTL